MELPGQSGWRGGYVLLGVGIVTALVVALDRRDGAPGDGTPRSADARFTLEPAYTWSFGWAEAPIAVAALDSSAIAYVPPDGRSVVLELDGRRHASSGFAEADISTIAADADRGEFWVGAGTELFTVPPGSGSVLKWAGYRMPGAITSVARTAASLWATYRAEAEAWLVELRIDEAEGTLELVGRSKVGSGSAVVHQLSDASVIVQERLAPYHLYEARAGSGVVRSFASQDVALGEGLALDTGSWVATSAVPLQEELVVQWLVDLRSTRRAAMLVDVARMEVVRITEFDAPVGLVHSLAGGGFVLGGHEVPGGREVVLYRVALASRRSVP